MFGVMCHVSGVTCHMSLKLTGTATKPPPAIRVKLPHYAQYSLSTEPKGLTELFLNIKKDRRNTFFFFVSKINGKLKTKQKNKSKR